MVVDKIYQYLNGQCKERNTPLEAAVRLAIQDLSWNGFNRQFIDNSKKDREGYISISGIGSCPRKQAYSYHKYPENGKEIDARGMITFWNGDMAEMCVTQLAVLAGVPIKNIGTDQKTVTYRFMNGNKEYSISGHPDGTIGDDVLFECKSMTSYGFEKFEKCDIDETYMTQINVYMVALGINKCCIVAFCKETGCLAEKIINADVKYVKEAMENIIAIKESTKEYLPKARYTFDDKGFYPWQCTYCGFWGTCHTNAERVLVGKSYKLKEKKTPTTKGITKETTPTPAGTETPK